MTLLLSRALVMRHARRHAYARAAAFATPRHVTRPRRHHDTPPPPRRRALLLRETSFPGHDIRYFSAPAAMFIIGALHMIL